MSDITVDLAALHDWETGAPETDPDRDPAFDPAEAATNTCPACDGSATEIIYHSTARDWETGEYLDSEEIPCPICDGTGRIAAPAPAPILDKTCWHCGQPFETRRPHEGLCPACQVLADEDTRVTRIEG